MNEFSTYIFKENDLRTNNRKVNKERPYYIAILIVLIALILYVLESDYAIHFAVVSYFLFLVGRITMSGKMPSIGYRPLALKLTPDAIFIGKERLEIRNKQDVEIEIVGYEGQPISQQTALYQVHNGNDNRMRIRYGNNITEFKFVLESEAHKDELIEFCHANGFEI